MTESPLSNTPNPQSLPSAAAKKKDRLQVCVFTTILRQHCTLHFLKWFVDTGMRSQELEASEVLNHESRQHSDNKI